MKTYSEYIIKKLLECRKHINLYKKHTVITHITKPNSRIVAIGDIHGDIDLMLKTLTTGGVIRKITEDTEDTSNNYIELRLINRDNKGEYNRDDPEYYKIEKYKWKGENTIVVQVGDQIDRCRVNSEKCSTRITTIKKNEQIVKTFQTTYDDEASDIEILLFFTNLHELAKKDGGAVYSLLGNHELMNSFGDIRYVSYENLEQVRLEERNVDNVDNDYITNEIGNDLGTNIENLENRRKHIFRRGGTLSNFLACTRSSILIVNEYLFVHGGVFGSFISKFNNDNNKYTIFEIINDVVKKWLMNNNDKSLNKTLEKKYSKNELYSNFFKKYDYNINNFIAPLPSLNNINDFIISTDSPFWIRTLGEIEANAEIDDDQCNEVKTLTDHFNLKGIVVGHTPQLKTGGINGTCSNKLYRIDIASSKAFYHARNGNLLPAQVLEIYKDDTQVLKEL
jgi:hypothetical protein